MQILISTFGSSGDVFPMLGLATALKARGHDVVFATNEHYATMAADNDIPFEPIGNEEQFQSIIRDPDLWHPTRSFGHLFNRLKEVVKPQHDLFQRFAARGRCAGLVNCLSLGGLMARETCSMPVVTMHCQPAVIWSDIAPPKLPGLFGPRWLRSMLVRIGEKLVIHPVALPFLNGWRRELGLPPITRLTHWWNSPDGILCMFPDWYCSPQEDWPHPFQQTDFPLWNYGSQGTLSHEVASFLQAGSPPIVFTPGSANVHGREFFATAIGACERLGHRAILLSEFPDHLPKTLPPSVLAVRYVPLDLLLPSASAFVHHGGIGSTSQGILAGIPQVIMPLAHDQFDNAERIRKLGIGTSLSVRRFRPSALAAVLNKLLPSEQIRQSCQHLRKQLQARDGLMRSAAAFEQLVAPKLQS